MRQSNFAYLYDKWAKEYERDLTQPSVYEPINSIATDGVDTPISRRLRRDYETT